MRGGRDRVTETAGDGRNLIRCLSRASKSNTFRNRFRIGVSGSFPHSRPGAVTLSAAVIAGVGVTLVTLVSKALSHFLLILHPFPLLPLGVSKASPYSLPLPSHPTTLLPSPSLSLFSFTFLLVLL